MKKIINTMARLIIVIAVIFAIGKMEYSIEHHYTRKNCEVVKINGYEVTVEDNMGRLWAFDGEGYAVGDRVNAKMYDNMTDTIKDDVIVDITKHLINN